MSSVIYSLCALYIFKAYLFFNWSGVCVGVAANTEQMLLNTSLGRCCACYPYFLLFVYAVMWAFGSVKLFYFDIDAFVGALLGVVVAAVFTALFTSVYSRLYNFFNGSRVIVPPAYASVVKAAPGR